MLGLFGIRFLKACAEIFKDTDIDPAIKSTGEANGKSEESSELRKDFDDNESKKMEICDDDVEKKPEERKKDPSKIN
jgi:hypothetical protein